MPNDGKSLNNDGAGNLSNEPDHTEALALKPAKIIIVYRGVHHVDGSPGRKSCNKHAETHRRADANLFNSLDPHIPHDHPGEECEDEVCYDIPH